MDNILKMHIGEGKDINLEIPTGAFENGSSSASMEEINPVKVDSIAENKDNLMEDKVIRSLTRKHFKVTEVRRGEKTKLEGTILYIREGIEKDAVLTNRSGSLAQNRMWILEMYQLLLIHWKC